MQDKLIGKFKLRTRCLTADGKRSETTQEFQGGLEGLLISGNPAPDIKDGQHYQPQSKTFPAFDSWTAEGVAQLTIADAHDITFHDSVKTSDLTMFARSMRARPTSLSFCSFSLIVDGKPQTVKQLMADQIQQWLVCFEPSGAARTRVRHPQ